MNDAPENKFKFIKGETIRYAEFSSISAHEQWTLQWLNHANYTQNKEEAETIKRQAEKGFEGDWYGNAPDIQSVLNAKNFSRWELVEQMRPALKAALMRFLAIKQKNKIEVKKIDFNDRETGVFSFDRAAMQLKKQYPPIMVRQLLLALNRSVDETIVSENKKSFVWFPVQKKPLPSVRIFIRQGALASISGTKMVYTGLAPYLLAELLLKKGYRVEVSVFMPSNIGFVSRTIIKPFYGQLDAQRLLMFSSDPRYFRYKGFLQVIVGADAIGKVVPPGLGAFNDDRETMRFIKKHVLKTNDIPVILPAAYTQEAVLESVYQAYQNILNHDQDAT